MGLQDAANATKNGETTTDEIKGSEKKKSTLDSMTKMMLYTTPLVDLIYYLKMFGLKLTQIPYSMFITQGLADIFDAIPASEQEKVKQAVTFASMGSGGGNSMLPFMLMQGGNGKMDQNTILMMTMMNQGKDGKGGDMNSMLPFLMMNNKDMDPKMKQMLMMQAMGGASGGINPMMYMMMGEGKEIDPMMLMMMSGNKDIDPMMLMMMNNKDMDPKMKQMMQMMMFNKNGSGGINPMMFYLMNNQNAGETGNLFK